ncbi:PRD domain-containing protein, partial [Acinetobacter baumannii]
MATEVVNMLNERLHIQLPEGEIGFIALHIHSALTNHQLSEVNQHSQLISRLVSVVEEQLNIRIDRESIHY